MTLNISLSTNRYVIQVSDRQLTEFDASGHIKKTDANKATVLVCSDAFVVITYHGIGRDHTGTLTDDWLVETLNNLKPFNRPVKDVLENLRIEATKWIRTISGATHRPVETLRHTFFVTGWHARSTPVVFLVSNFENLKTKERVDNAWSEFAGSFSKPKPEAKNYYSLRGGGDVSARVMEDSELLARLAQLSGAKPEDVLNVMVQSLRKAASRSDLISKNCISTVLLKGSTLAKCAYHTDAPGATVYAPNFVGPYSISGVKITRGVLPPI